MEAIKNLRESPALLSNLNVSDYSGFAKAIIPSAWVEAGSANPFFLKRSVAEMRYTILSCVNAVAGKEMYHAVDELLADEECAVIYTDLCRIYREALRLYPRENILADRIVLAMAEEERKCELPTLLSNLNMSSYDELAERIYSFSRVEECLYYDTDEKESMGWVEKIVLDSAEARDRDLMAGISMFATEDEYRILYSKLCGMAQMSYWLDLDMELTQNAAIAAEEMARESAFISDEFEVFFDEETGEYETIYTGESSCDTIAEENHYPADDLPF